MRLRILLLVLLATPVVAQEPRSVAVDGIFARWRSDDRPGCVVLVDRGGELLHVAGYGVADVATRRPLTPDTPMYIASVSKQFTAACIAHLIELRQLSLGTDVRMFVPSLPNYGKRITVADLLHHRSGLRDFYELSVLRGIDLDAAVDKAEILALVARQKALNFAPGTEFSYSNTNYLLLAEIVEKVSEFPLGEYAQRSLFTLLDIEHSVFRHSADREIPGVAAGHERTEDGYRARRTRFALPGPGGLFATARDLRRWLRNFATHEWGGELFERMEQAPESDAEVVLSPSGAYAYGLFVGEYHGRRMISHPGGAFGFQAMTARFPDDDLSIVILANAADVPVAELLRSVADVFLPAEVAAEAAAATPVAQRPAGFALFRHPIDGEMLVLSTRPDGRSHASTLSWKEELTPIDDRSMRGKHSGLPLTVTVPPGGDQGPKRAIVQIGRQAPRTYERLPPAKDPDPAAVAGSYHSPEVGATVQFVVRDGRLRLDDAGLSMSFPPFMPAGEDVWISDRGVCLDVERDAAGAVTAVRFSSRGMRNLRFARE